MKKKNVLIMLLCCVLLLTGCSNLKQWYEDYLDHGPTPSIFNGVSSAYEYAYIGKRIAYSRSKLKLFFSDIDGKNKKSFNLPDNHEIYSISAGKDYFYVYSINENLTKGYLRLYNKNGKFKKEVRLFFAKIFVRDGIIYGLDSKEIQSDCDSNPLTIEGVEATHYIEEKRFLKNFPDNKEQWNTFNGKEKQEVNDMMFYRYTAGYLHSMPYYSNEKPLEVLEQVGTITFIDGTIFSDEDDTEVKPRMKQIYSMMRQKEKNFSLWSFEMGNEIFGVCNVYKRDTLNTKDLSYSFSFRYGEKKDELYKVKTYDNRELIFENQEICLYHKEDGVYLERGKINKRVYAYDGLVYVNVVYLKDGYLQFLKNDLEKHDSYTIRKFF
jgi:hypothetical protein